jgi:ATP-dependent Clp protease ATP-binding subunit ClpA
MTMFERFTQAARADVTEALVIAQQEGSPRILGKHLLLAVLRREAEGAALLRRAGLTLDADALAARLAATKRRGGLSEADTQALQRFGIDVDQIVASIEDRLGESALDPDRPIADGTARGRRRPSRPRFSDDAKRVLALALRQAVELGDRHLDEEHLVLGLLLVPGVVQDELTALGVTHAATLTALRRAAS